MNKQIIQIGTLALLLFAGGCSNDNDLVPEPIVSGEITIQTRADEAGEYRLLAFNADDGACAFNQVIKADGTATTWSLADGKYNFVTLTGAGQFNLPEVGKTDALTFSGAITLKSSQSLNPVNISRATEITIPTDLVYAVELLPATCKVTLVVKDKGMLKDGCTFSLKNMNNGFRPDGTDPVTAPHTLVEGENVCFPTTGTAILSSQIGSAGEQTLDLKQVFLAGKSYTVTLTYKEGFSLKDIKINEWDNTDHEQDVDAKLP